MKAIQIPITKAELIVLSSQALLNSITFILSNFNTSLHTFMALSVGNFPTELALICSIFWKNTIMRFGDYATV